jgi:formylglycine-generating enzyme required for sulfatase activity
MMVNSDNATSHFQFTDCMNKRTSKLVRWVSLGLPFLATAPRLLAQVPAILDLHVYPGLTITGAVGTVYAIQATADLAQTNNWICLEFLRLPTSTHLWLDATAPGSERRFYRAVAIAPTNLVFIPPGTFRMGSPTNEVGRNDDESPQTEVTLTHGFYLEKYAVRQADYLAVMGNNPSYFSGLRNGTDYGTDLTRPVERVTWNNATNYCAKRTQLEVASGLIPSGAQYRLPTEAEWEYACRAWTSTRYFFGDDPGYADLGDFAWYNANSDNMTHAVGTKLPNPWGLYDILGNVVEWCQDWYGPYQGGSLTDPQGPPLGTYRVTRGGTCVDDATISRAAFRGWDLPTKIETVYGFRVVLGPSSR